MRSYSQAAPRCALLLSPSIRPLRPTPSSGLPSRGCFRLCFQLGFRALRPGRCFRPLFPACLMTVSDGDWIGLGWTGLDWTGLAALPLSLQILWEDLLLIFHNCMAFNPAGTVYNKEAR